MSAARIAFATMLGLSLLEAATRNTKNAGRIGQLLTGTAGVIRRVLSPTVAAIPDRRKHGGAVPAADTSDNGSLLPASWSTSATDLYNA